MTYASSPRKGLRGLLVALAGPLGNYVMLLILPKINIHLPQVFFEQFALANAAMMFANLLPAFPLDGGRMVFSLGYYVCNLSVLTGVLTGLGILAGCLMVIGGIYSSVVFGCLNLSVLLVGFYLITCAVKSRSTLFAENLFALVQERMDAPKHIRLVRFYTVPGETKLYELVDVIGRSPSAAFLVKNKEDTILLPEQDILEAMLSDPHEAVSALIDENLHKTI